MLPELKTLSNLLMSQRQQSLPTAYSEQIYLLTVHVAGLHYYDGGENISQGQTLKLIRTPDNQYDKWAIEIRLPDDQIVGHIPRQSNLVLARLMDAGKQLTAVVKEIICSTAQLGDKPEQVRVRIYMENL